MIAACRASAIRQSILTCITAISFSSTVFAGNLAVNVLAGGTVFDFGHNNNIVFPAGSFRTDTFKINGNPIDYTVAVGLSDNNIQIPQWACNVGYFFHDFTLGANFYWSKGSRTGTVLEYGLPQFADSTYYLQVESGRMMFDTELNFYPTWKGLTPFLEGGLGLARNTLYFRNKPDPDVAGSGGYYALNQHAQLQFAYEIGAGVTWPVPMIKQMNVSARYLFANAGRAQSKTHDGHSGVALGQPIRVRVESQSILVGLNYLFG